MSSVGSCDPDSSDVRSYRSTAPPSCTIRRVVLAISIHETTSSCTATEAVLNDPVLVFKQLSNNCWSCDAYTRHTLNTHQLGIMTNKPVLLKRIFFHHPHHTTASCRQCQSRKLLYYCCNAMLTLMSHLCYSLVAEIQPHPLHHVTSWPNNLHTQQWVYPEQVWPTKYTLYGIAE